MPPKPLFILTLLLLPVFASAADFVPLVRIPGIDANASFNDYINTLYALSISIAALIAVIKIIIAGVKWMLTDIVSSKQEAKSDIQGALLGLLLIIAAVLILEVINPQLKSSSLFLGKVGTVTRAPAVGGGEESTTPYKNWDFGDTACPDTTKNTSECQAIIANCTSKDGKVVVISKYQTICSFDAVNGGGEPMNPGVGGGEGNPNISSTSSTPVKQGGVTMTTMAASKIERNSAILQSSVTPGNMRTWAKYGTSENDLNQGSTVSIIYDDANSTPKIHDSFTSYSVPLTPNTVYYYTICATNNAGTLTPVCGNLMKFKTLP